MNSLHDLEISLVYYNGIRKKTCLIPVLDQNLFIFPPKTHVVGMIEII